MKNIQKYFKNYSLFVVFFLLIITVSVKAQDIGSAGQAGTGGGGTCYDTSYVCIQGLPALRISLVDKNGNRVSGTKTYDLFAQKSAENWKLKEFFEFSYTILNTGKSKTIKGASIYNDTYFSDFYKKNSTKITGNKGNPKTIQNIWSTNLGVGYGGKSTSGTTAQITFYGGSWDNLRGNENNVLGHVVGLLLENNPNYFKNAQAFYDWTQDKRNQNYYILVETLYILHLQSYNDAQKHNANFKHYYGTATDISATIAGHPDAKAHPDIYSDRHEQGHTYRLAHNLSINTTDLSRFKKQRGLSWGITGIKKNTSNTKIVQIADRSKAYGMGLINVKDVAEEHESNECASCYQVGVDANDGDCTLASSGSYSQSLDQVNRKLSSCTGSNYTMSEFGVSTKRINQYCSLYCLENVTTQFPEGISNALKANTLIVWPTYTQSQSQFIKQFPLSVTGELTCYVAMNADPYCGSDKDNYATLAETAYQGYLKIVKREEQNMKQALKDKDEAEKTVCNQMTYCVPECPEGRFCNAYPCADVIARKACQENKVLRIEQAIRDYNEAKARKEAAEKNLRNLNQELIPCVTATFDQQNLYNFDASLAISYDDKQYGFSDYPLTKASSDTACIGCGQAGKILTITGKYEQDYKAIKNAVAGRNGIRITTTQEFKLPEGLNNYFDKVTNELITNITSASNNYLWLNQSNLSLGQLLNYSKNQKFSGNVSIKIKSIGNTNASGSGSMTKYVHDDYTCPYNVTLETSGCICPTGTAHAGENPYELYCKVRGNEITSSTITEDAYTCAEAIHIFCDDATWSATDEHQYYYCGCEDGEIPDSCLAAGLTFEECCGGMAGKKYTCSPGTKYAGMDITTCVLTRIKQGSTLAQAQKYCDNALCLASSANIVYRTISLEDPFPGKEATGPASGFNTTVDWGRYPGANWNSELVVKSKITNNRNVRSEDVYKKEPLYVVELDSAAIKSVRRYNSSRNKSGGYGDFTLECDKGHHCLSTFLRSNDIVGATDQILVSGSCKNISSGSFDDCTK